MRGRKGISILATALALSFLAAAGCEDTAKHTVQVRRPAATPQVSLVAAASIGELPLPEHIADLQDLALTPHPAVDALIEQVQASYDAGQQAYQAGQLDVARKDFSAALDHLMTSGLENTGDQRLQELFNRIVDTMQNYEMEAEQKDEAAADNEDDMDADTTDDTQATTQPESTAPIEEIANMESLPATDPRLAAMAEKELISIRHDLPLTVNASVLQYLSFFESPRGRAIVEVGLQRAGRYRAMIESTLKKEGVPQDLIYLAQAESAFKPRVVSSMGARGIWQFMPYTGEEYGLSRDYWVDKRDDPAAATRAAAEHFRDLYQMFGDWYLVMAAYNSGPLNVARAVERTGYADFWELQRRNALPEQTKNYVPIILALTMIAKDPLLYGIHVAPDPPLKFDTVTLNHSISLRLVADATDASLDDLEALNPELVRGITPNEAGFALHVPEGTGAALQKEIASIPADKLVIWRIAKLQPGQTLGDIARQYHVTVASLENVNVIDAKDPPAVGTELIVPTAPPRARLIHYRVRRGDTLDGIASRYDVSVREIQRWNHLRTERAPRGRTIRIYENTYPTATPVRDAAAPQRATPRHPATARMQKTAQRTGHNQSVKHRVLPGETLWSIAHTYGTTVAALRQENPFLADRDLRAGDRLNVATKQ
ncbi:MAG TPA: LysM peptidoglycan-binding domain-containing protein [Candidatus Acidoferrales bacterium]|nr:LysM peptidoglycan-binding domain-containing protein [Candidatus Acidoferrales bacterium]